MPAVPTNVHAAYVRSRYMDIMGTLPSPTVQAVRTQATGTRRDVFRSKKCIGTKDRNRGSGFLTGDSAKQGLAPPSFQCPSSARRRTLQQTHRPDVAAHWAKPTLSLQSAIECHNRPHPSPSTGHYPRQAPVIAKFPAPDELETWLIFVFRPHLTSSSFRTI